MSIKHWLKKYFIPHERNDHRPHFLRNESVMFILVVVLLIEAGFMAQPIVLQKTGLFASILQNVLINDTNASRQSQDIATLKENPLLDAAAQLKANDMAAKGYFAHVSPAGIDPWHWIREAGYNYTYAGENLAINFSDSEDVVNAWLNSPAHRANLLSQRFTEIGIATAKGAYDGKDTIFIVQMFGKPAEIQAPILPQPKVAETPVEPRVLGATSPVANAVLKATASPRTTSNYVYAFLTIITSLALLLNIVIKIKIQHSKLILNGIILLLIINSIVVLNQYLSLTNAKIF